MRRTAGIAIALLIGATLAADVAAVAKSPRTAPAGRPVGDRTFTFDVFRIMCGSGKAGDADSTLDPNGLFCMVAVGVVNNGARRPLDPYSQFLVIDGKRYPTSRRAMVSMTLDDSSNLFSRPIPPGGGGLASLFFEIPRGPAPTSLELHEVAGSRGAIALFPRCSWSDNGGGCAIEPDRGEPGNAYPHSPQPGVRYPHAMVLDQPTCFGGTEWRARPGPDPESFWGQGLISLHESGLVAYFYDNAGPRMELVPTQQNVQDSKVCG